MFNLRRMKHFISLSKIHIRSLAPGAEMAALCAANWNHTSLRKVTIPSMIYQTNITKVPTYSKKSC